MGNKTTNRGRPSTGRSEYLEVRLTPKEKARYEKAAEAYGLSLSDWVRLNLTACSQSQPDPRASQPLHIRTGGVNE